jgi:hypothetical protein
VANRMEVGGHRTRFSAHEVDGPLLLSPDLKSTLQGALAPEAQMMYKRNPHDRVLH